MLKRIGVEIYYHIETHSVNSRAKEIALEIAAGSLVEGEFVSDGRSLIKHSIVNIADKPEIDLGGGNIIPAVPGRDWFNEAAMFVSDNNPEYANLTDEKYISTRLWTIVLAMGFPGGEII